MNRTKRMAVRIGACVLAFMSFTATGVSSYIPAMDSPAAIVEVSAASTSSSKNKKLTGVSTAYVSNAWPSSLEICVKCNTNAQLDNLEKFLNGLAKTTSGAKAASYVTSSGITLVPGIKGKAILTVATKIFKSASGVSNSARKAATELKNLRKKNPNKGIKLYFGVKKWKVYVQ